MREGHQKQNAPCQNRNWLTLGMVSILSHPFAWASQNKKENPPRERRLNRSGLRQQAIQRRRFLLGFSATRPAKPDIVCALFSGLDLSRSWGRVTRPKRGIPLTPE